MSVNMLNFSRVLGLRQFFHKLCAKDLADNHITGESLLECDQSVLKELGIERVGDRVRIFVAVKNLRRRTLGTQKKRNRVFAHHHFANFHALTNLGYLCCFRELQLVFTFRSKFVQPGTHAVVNKRFHTTSSTVIFGAQVNKSTRVTY